jgi:hypothetical protein
MSTVKSDMRKLSTREIDQVSGGSYPPNLYTGLEPKLPPYLQPQPKHPS